MHSGEPTHLIPALLKVLLFGSSAALTLSIAGGQTNPELLATEEARKHMALHVTSTAFAEGQPIPEKYSCDGQNISPPLKWDGAPNNTKSVAIIVDDPDAPSGTFVHWVLYDVPGATTQLSEGSSGDGKEGVNGSGKTGYRGPCPPPGNAHRYYFHVHALDIESLGNPGMSKQEAIAAMKGHVVAEGQLMGRYKRRK
jgi:Raf kinase inhibitor-like YbhB/YbcL family protein